MASYRISGIWKGSASAISHYAMHDVTNIEKSEIGPAQKVTRVQAIALVEAAGNIVTTIVWNYTNPGWYATEKVHVVTEGANKYLRSNRDTRLTDNLGHLPDYAFIF